MHSPYPRRAYLTGFTLQDYYTLLDQHCPDLKVMPGGGIGWFAHIYSDSQEPGYGIYDYNGRPKFPFHPRTTC